MNREIEEKEVKLFAYNNLFYFAKAILGYKDLDNEIHQELCNFTQNSEGILLILEPRDHFKTSAVTISYSIWTIVNNPDIRILISHKSLKKAKSILSEIKQHFETNEILRYYFGNFVSEDKWSEAEIIVSKRTKIAKEATISTGAVTHEQTGGHFDLIINDDLCGLKDMLSVAERETVLAYYKTMKYLRDKGTFVKEINIGTRWHTDDLYGWMIDKNIANNKRVKSAIIDGEPYFKTRYKIKELEKMRDEDPIFFSSVMMNEPRNLDRILYPLNELNFFDYDTFDKKYCMTMAYIDPAFGKKVGHEPCYFCFVIGAIKNNDVYIIEFISNKNKPEQNEQLIINKIKEHGIKILGIESNAAQSEFIRGLNKEFAKNLIHISVDEINHSQNKDRRIQAMHGVVKKNIYFRKDWETAHGNYSESIKQLTLYPEHKYLDAPDALEGLLGMNNNLNGHFERGIDDFKRNDVNISSIVRQEW